MPYSAKWSSKFYISLEKEREDRSTAPLGVESTAGDRTAGLRRYQPSTDYDQHAHEALQRCSTARSVRAATSVKSKVKYPDIAVRSLTYHTATGTHMPYRITQRWHSHLYPSRSWYSIKRSRRDARMQICTNVMQKYKQHAYAITESTDVPWFWNLRRETLVRRQRTLSAGNSMVEARTLCAAALESNPTTSLLFTLLSTALAGMVKRSVLSVRLSARPFVFTQTFEQLDPWPWFLHVFKSSPWLTWIENQGDR